MGRSVAAKMKWISGLLVLLPLLVNGATYEETRQVKDSAGKKFTCTYKLAYNNKGVFNKAKSSAVCKPNKTGKTVTETFVIESIGKSVTVKHAVKKGKKAITSIKATEYAPPTGAPAPPLDMTHNCKCRLAPDSQGRLLSAVKTALPSAVDRQLLSGGLLSGLVPAPVPAPGGIDLASLLGGSGNNDLVTQLAMQVAQQQLNDFINNGGAEEAITNLVESGQLEEMVTNFVESGQAEAVAGQLMENVNMEEVVGQLAGQLEQQMAENIQNGGELLSSNPLGEMLQSVETMDVNTGLEELINSMPNIDSPLISSELASQLGNMEMLMQCSCDPIA